MSPRTNLRYVSSTNPYAVYRALGGNDNSNCNVDMDGWSEDSSFNADYHNFSTATQDEVQYGMGQAYSYVILRRINLADREKSDKVCVYGIK